MGEVFTSRIFRQVKKQAKYLFLEPLDKWSNKQNMRNEEKTYHNVRNCRAASKSDIK